MTRRPKDQHRWGRTLRRWHEAELGAASTGMSLPPFEVWRSRDFLVQLFADDGNIRVTVNRTHMPNGKDWAEGITWDDLQQLKREIGHADTWAVEVFPADEHLVDVANLRHLWLLDGPPPYGWCRDDSRDRTFAQVLS